MPAFDIEFQTRMLAVAVREPAFLALYSDTLRPSIFSNQYLRDLATWILEFNKTIKTPPTAPWLKGIKYYLSASTTPT